MKRTPNMPDLVYWGLWGVKSRASALAWMFLCVALGVGSVVYGFKDPVYFFGAGLFPAAFWYLYCIRWVDRNGGWGNGEVA